MRMKHIKIGITCIFLIIFIFLIYKIFFETTYSEGSTSLDVPVWLDSEFSVASAIVDGEPGPTIGADDDTYAVFKIRFYDASTEELITDKSA